MKFGTDICGAQGMNPHGIGDPMTFHLVSLAGQSFHFCVSIHTDIYSSQTKQLNPSDLLIFPLVTPSHLWLLVKCLDNYWRYCHKFWYKHSCSPEDEPY